MSQNKIIDIWSERLNRHGDDQSKSKDGLQSETSTTTNEPSESSEEILPGRPLQEPLSIQAALSEIEKRDRRLVKRTILEEFVGAFVVVPTKGLIPIKLHDISEAGMAFDLPAVHGRFQPQEVVPVRIYLNRTNYFSFQVLVNNSRISTDEKFNRHGAYIQSADNEEALYHFIRFVESVSHSLHKDQGDRVRLRR